MSDVNDELDGSPILEEVLGDALGKLKVFHVKLAAEGEPRGLIGPRDVGIIWERHILNSAAIVPFIREATAKRQFKTVADIAVSWRPPACRTTSSLWWNRWNAVSNGFMSALTKWDWTMSR